MDERRVAGHDSGSERVLVLCGLFTVFVALGILRSRGWSLTPTVGEGGGDDVAMVGYALLLALGALFVWAVQAPERATYLLGGSAALGVFPAIPKLPFLQDVTHVALILFLVANWRSLRVCWNNRTQIDPRLVAYLAFLLLAVVSVAVNFLQRGDVWQLKVGLSGLLLLGVLLMALCVMVVSPAPTVFNQLRNGFLDSAQIAAAFGCLAIVLLVVTPYSTGLTGDGRETLWGLAYFDRLKLMFDGPGVAAIYFVGAMGFAVHALSEYGNATRGWSRTRLLFLVQVSPWLIVATGSRVGKIALGVLILTGLSWKSVRRASLIALPMTFAALLIALDFQSFPSAVKFQLGYFFPEFFDTGALEKLRLAGRFLALEERGDLMYHAIGTIREAPLLNQIIGMGYGVSGYRSSLYPSPHDQFISLIVQVGVLGFVSYLLFWLTCSWRVLESAWKFSSSGVGASWAFGASLISICGLAVAYEVETKGWILVLLLMMFNWAGVSSDKSCRL
ncbi:O-antigen ligase family protein [Laribacter hongkongensis]|uniref:O-antigen ligase family protein n=1 Tax=Laribacter hongkongensis TaxID=168471 RepID=UPI001EFC2EBA|nr:O-antigen ligase family protein [Laribacter hongkongensis]MCG9095344.1 O-antigen ligase family protein [Laribacter hongkongensis]